MEAAIIGALDERAYPGVTFSGPSSFDGGFATYSLIIAGCGEVPKELG